MAAAQRAKMDTITNSTASRSEPRAAASITSPIAAANQTAATSSDHRTMNRPVRNRVSSTPANWGNAQKIRPRGGFSRRDMDRQ